MGWKRLWIQAYNCPDVVNAILNTGIEVVSYSDGPGDAASLPTDIRRGDVLFAVNYFGLKEAAEYAGFYKAGIPVIEDHSHDPWSIWAMQSKADYVIVSLRKSLPIPDGGALWSNTGSPMPSEPGANLVASPEVAVRIEAMLLKSIYLGGGSAGKEEYLNLFEWAKTKLIHSTMQPNRRSDGISQLSRTLLKVFPWRQWRENRLANYRYFLNKVRTTSDYRALEGGDHGVYPFSLVLLFDDRNRRDIVKQRLISRFIYPAIVWPIERKRCPWSDERAEHLSERLMSIHCDGRYGQEDMEKIAAGFSACVNS